jgi:hypothetical protein
VEVSTLDISKEEYISGLINDLKNVKYIMPDDIPNIDLYMDQVTTFMDRHLKSSKRYSEDKLLTKTMINNYTKNELLPPPDKKKYTKEHMFLLIFIYYFKNILSISDIQSIFNPLTERYYGGKSDIGLEEIYGEIFRLENEQTDALTKDMIRKMTKAKESFEFVKDKEDHDFLSMFSFISTLCFDVYMRKHVIEQLIDNSLKEYSKNGKESNKESNKDNNKDNNKVNNKDNNKVNNKDNVKKADNTANAKKTNVKSTDTVATKKTNGKSDKK